MRWITSLTNYRDWTAPALLAAAGALGVALRASPAPAAEDAGANPTAEQIKFYEEKVKPVLVDNCYNCHSKAAKKVKAGLKIDTRADLLKGGEDGVVLIPGDPDKSLFVQSIKYNVKDEDQKMPPPEKKPKIPDAQIAAIEKWVKDGAAMSEK